MYNFQNINKNSFHPLFFQEKSHFWYYSSVVSTITPTILSSYTTVASDKYFQKSNIDQDVKVVIRPSVQKQRRHSACRL